MGNTPELRSYQKRAVLHLLENDRAALLLEMGLGKTATVLTALIDDEHLPALVVAPKRIAENVWDTEAQIWRPELSVAVAAGSPAKRKAALASDADITAIGVDNLKDVPLGKYKTFILDELSLYKNHDTRRFKILRRLTKKTPYVWGLTGTPSPNGYQDLWAQMFLLDRGRRLGTTVGEFRHQFLFPALTIRNANGHNVTAKWGLQDGAAADIEHRISDICLSMQVKDYLELPKVTFNDIAVDMPAKAWKAYTDMKDTLVAMSEKADYSAANGAVALSKLSQITSGFLLPDADSPTDDIWRIHDVRLKAAAEIAETATSPLLIFYQFREERRWLLKNIKGAKAVDESGAIKQFMAGDLPVLVAHPASAGHGLNFQHVCHTIVWITLPWSSEQYLQANARVDRQGQKHPVVIHRLKVNGTVDEVVEKALLDKKSVQDAVLDSLK